MEKISESTMFLFLVGLCAVYSAALPLTISDTFGEKETLTQECGAIKCDAKTQYCNITTQVCGDCAATCMLKLHLDISTKVWCYKHCAVYVILQEKDTDDGNAVNCALFTRLSPYIIIFMIIFTAMVIIFITEKVYMCWRDKKGCCNKQKSVQRVKRWNIVKVKSPRIQEMQTLNGVD
ncbi:unnamed protein product [Owenia fusiformis]|uniref:Uncharacterized protein n=1 Tax=Owenia fusiformis TaxID=6347 RepID=A0A8J1U4A3_OWEFU|nr:unnamed protein product [Owenia fusiformis]